MLNWGYYWLLARLSGLVRLQGLDPYTGFLHDGRNDDESLVIDLRELFRVHIDRTVLRLINESPGVTVQHFQEARKGWRLTQEGTRLLAKQLEWTFREPQQNGSLNKAMANQVGNMRNWLVGEPLQFLD